MSEPITLKDIFGNNPFNADRQLKAQITNSFWSDSNDFLYRVEAIKLNMPHDTKGYLAKMYVDLLMCAECALKSLIISLSDDSETPEDAYLAARGKSHDLEKLYAEVETRAAGRIHLLTPDQKSTLLKANTLGVGYRYDVTTFFFLSQENIRDRAFERGSVSSIINYSFISGFYSMLHDLANIANRSTRQHFGNDNSLSGSNLEALGARLDAFFATMQKKL